MDGGFFFEQNHIFLLHICISKHFDSELSIPNILWNGLNQHRVWTEKDNLSANVKQSW